MSKDSRAIRNRSRLDAAVLRNCKFKRSNAQKHGVSASPVIIPGEDLSSKVRGRPFQQGNPGRPPGSKNKTTRLVEQLVEGDAEKLSRKMLELAANGNVRCLEYCLDRLLPKRSGRPLDFQLPAINSVQDLIAAMGKVSTAVNNGELTAEEAAQIVHLLEGYGKIFTIYDIAARLETLETQMKEKGLDLTPSQRITKFGRR